MALQGVNLKIVANSTRDISAWQGASVIASMQAQTCFFSFLLQFACTVDLTSGGCGCRDSFMNTVISQETYEDEGPEVVHKLNIFALS